MHVIHPCEFPRVTAHAMRPQRVSRRLPWRTREELQAHVHGRDRRDLRPQYLNPPDRVHSWQSENQGRPPVASRSRRERHSTRRWTSGSSFRWETRITFNPTLATRRCAVTVSCTIAALMLSVSSLAKSGVFWNLYQTVSGRRQLARLPRRPCRLRPARCGVHRLQPSYRVGNRLRNCLPGP